MNIFKRWAKAPRESFIQVNTGEVDKGVKEKFLKLSKPEEMLDLIIPARILILKMIQDIYDYYPSFASLDSELPDKMLELLYQAKRESYKTEKDLSKLNKEE